MSSLQALQQRLLEAVLADRPPRSADWRADTPADAGERLAIYRNGYRVRLRDALATEFPGLALLAGRRFDALLDAYVEAHPSGHYNIRWHGAGLAAFLAYGLPWREKPVFAEMAELDWAISTVFDAADTPAFAATDLAGLPPEAWAALRLHAQPHLRVLTVHHNVEAFRRAADRGGARPRPRRFDKPRRLLVWRLAMSVHYRAVPADEASALAGVLAGEPFGTLCECLAAHHAADEALPRMAALLHRWLADSLLSGWSAPVTAAGASGM